MFESFIVTETTLCEKSGRFPRLITIRILLLTQWFDPEPTFKGIVFARKLVELGFQVEVVTGFPNYPGGRLYPGYRQKLIQRESIDGVFITRLPLFPSHGQSAIGRVLNYLSFSISAVIYGLFVAKRPDVIYAYHPPLTVGMAAVFIRLLRRIPLVYDVQDMWPDTLKATGMISNALILRIIGRVCLWVYRHVDQLVVLSPGFKALLVERGVPGEKVEIIYNWCSEDALSYSSQNLSDTVRGDRPFRIMFAGNMGKAQSLDAVIHAAARLSKKNSAIEFTFLGGGVEVDHLRQLVENLAIKNVSFLPAVPMDQVAHHLLSADALLVHLRNDPLFSITIPSKTQAYMAVGKPIIMAVNGDAAELVGKSGCGVTAEPEDPESIADAVNSLYEKDIDELHNIGKKGRIYYQNYLALSVGANRFEAIFKEIAKDATRV